MSPPTPHQPRYQWGPVGQVGRSTCPSHSGDRQLDGNQGSSPSQQSPCWLGEKECKVQGVSHSKKPNTVNAALFFHAAVPWVIQVLKAHTRAKQLDFKQGLAHSPEAVHCIPVLLTLRSFCAQAPLSLGVSGKNTGMDIMPSPMGSFNTMMESVALEPRPVL